MDKKAVLLAAILPLSAPSATSAKTLKEALQKRAEEIDEAKKVQKKVDQLDSQRVSLLETYRLKLGELQDLRVYADQLKTMVHSQEAEIKEKQEHIEELHGLNQRVYPLMFRMVDAMEKLVATDMPFLVAERESRIKELRTLLDRADVSTSEKMRKIFEAYQTENAYGRTLGAYVQNANIQGHDVSLSVLRIGRIALMGQTLDRKSLAIWHPQSRQWQTLDKKYLPSVERGLQIARKQMAPELLVVPVLKGAKQ